MRNASYINALWDAGGPFTGEDGKPHSRATVQRPWPSDDDAVLDGDEDHITHPTWDKAGKRRERGVPIRWYQKLDDTQIEEEIPNIRQISIDRSIESDAAACNITIYNQWMYDNGAVPDDQVSEGNRHFSGYFTPTRGLYPEGQVRWGHEINEWVDTFVPNTLIRTYQGYGGHSKTLQECLDDGNLILTGVWLVDEVQISTAGDLQLRCRDMAKLLVDQQLYLPLIPPSKYPLTYFRWTYENFKVHAANQKITRTSTTTVPAGNKRAQFRTSSVDTWYPGFIATGGKVLHGHKGSDSLDVNTSTYWLGEGNSGPDKVFATSWIEYNCGEQMNAVYVHPWGGNYEMYISIMEDGRWQGTATVPYDHTPLIGNQPHVVDTGADIPYVSKVGVPWEVGREYVLPRAYRADRVRISFRHLTYSGIGPWMYRAGVREFRIRATASAVTATRTSTVIAEPRFFAADSIRNPENLNQLGYITSTMIGVKDAFGDARLYPKSGGDATSGDVVAWLEFTRAGDGYWEVRHDGRVTAYGNAPFHGSPHQDGYVGAEGTQTNVLAPTPTGDGYWVLSWNGTIHAYGDATEYASLTTIPAGEIVVAGQSHTSSHGLWILDSSGTVHVRGSATHYGDYTETALSGRPEGDYATFIACSLDNDGYWILTSDGRVQARGGVTDHGQIFAPVVSKNAREMYWHLLASPDSNGYLIMKGDGNLYPFGDVQFFGSPVPGTQGQIRKDGNYKDYADIIKDLALWSGFLLYDDTISDNDEPALYGSIETTGAYAEEQLPDDIFDKRPVIDAMQQIKEVVGYLLYVDDEGGFRFESPNYWSAGNFIQETGERVYDLPEIDERVNLVDYGVSWDDESLRSLIIISSEDPDEAGSSTVTTKIVPETAKGLRGLLKPAMWVNGWFQNEDEQRIMAELIAMHIWFGQRIGQVSCIANPALQINDQVRVYERQTSEVFIHYIRGINSTHDLDTGQFNMTLTTHWLGTGEEWAITDSPDYVEDPRYFVISDLLKKWRDDRQGEMTQRRRPATLFGTDPLGPGGSGSQGAAT